MKIEIGQYWCVAPNIGFNEKSIVRINMIFQHITEDYCDIEYILVSQYYKSTATATVTIAYIEKYGVYLGNNEEYVRLLYG